MMILTTKFTLESKGCNYRNICHMKPQVTRLTRAPFITTALKIRTVWVTNSSDRVTVYPTKKTTNPVQSATLYE